MRYLKSAGRLLDRDYGNREDLDLPNEVLQVFVVQRAAELPAVKVRGQKKNMPFSPV